MPAPDGARDRTYAAAGAAHDATTAASAAAAAVAAAGLRGERRGQEPTPHASPDPRGTFGTLFLVNVDVTWA
jgi:hypothetical protein